MMMNATIDSSFSPLLQTKALIVKYIGENKVHDDVMTKAMCDSIIEKIRTKGKDNKVIEFKTEMTL